MNRYIFTSLTIMMSGCAASSLPTSGAPALNAPTLQAEPEAEATQVATEEMSQDETLEKTPPEKIVQAPALVPALPTSCSPHDDNCVPPKDFAHATCKGRYPGMAIVMFEKSTPWQRLYLKAENLAPENAHDGPISADRLMFGEEVLVLKNEVATDGGGIVMSGSSDIDVLRWDGSCVTARREMFATYRMPEPRNALVKWRRLDKSVQGGLLEAKYVSIRRKSQRKACQSSSSRSPSAACKKANESLNEAIKVAVRGGISLPMPDKLPIWAPVDQKLALTETP